MDISSKTITAYGLATLAADGTVLDARFSSLSFAERLLGKPGTRTLTPNEAHEKLASSSHRLLTGGETMATRLVAVCTQIADLADAPVDRHDLFLRLYLLSCRHAMPGKLNLGGLDMYIPVAWTSRGPCLPEHFEEVRWRCIQGGKQIDLYSMYHVPRMTDYVMPAGVRILNTHNVRLGAYLSPGTMVTAAGFCNSNAGTLGPAMVEGQISRGVTVEAGCHVGAGAVLMGTTSGGGRVNVSLGQDCLVGANAGVGIALGEGCVVEAGCYVTAGSLVSMPEGNVVKALELSGRPHLLFRRNSVSGKIEALPSKGFSGLQPSLHSTDISKWSLETSLLA